MMGVSKDKEQEEKEMDEVVGQVYFSEIEKENDKICGKKYVHIDRFGKSRWGYNCGRRPNVCLLSSKSL